jgi:hypothetical protein
VLLIGVGLNAGGMRDDIHWTYAYPRYSFAHCVTSLLDISGRLVLIQCDPAAMRENSHTCECMRIVKAVCEFGIIERLVTLVRDRVAMQDSRAFLSGFHVNFSAHRTVPTPMPSLTHYTLIGTCYTTYYSQNRRVDA